MLDIDIATLINGGIRLHFCPCFKPLVKVGCHNCTIATLCVVSPYFAGKMKAYEVVGELINKNG